MSNEQMELGFGSATALRHRPRRQGRRERAAWWFGQMRALLDRVPEWCPTPPARPEQPCLPGTLRPVQV